MCPTVATSAVCDGPPMLDHHQAPRFHSKHRSLDAGDVADLSDGSPGWITGRGSGGAPGVHDRKRRGSAGSAGASNLRGMLTTISPRRRVVSVVRQ